MGDCHSISYIHSEGKWIFPSKLFCFKHLLPYLLLIGNISIRRYHKLWYRRIVSEIFTGTFRVLTDDYSQFSLFDDFDNDFHEILTDYDRYEPVKPDPEQDELFVGCRDNASNCLKGKPKNDILSESHVLYHVKKISRYNFFTKALEIPEDLLEMFIIFIILQNKSEREK